MLFIAAAVLFASATAAPNPLRDDEVLARVNGTPITRRELRDALDERAKEEYRNATEDLHDVEKNAVRDYVGRQCIDREAAEKRTTADAIVARELATDFSHFDPNMRNRIEQQRERIYNAEKATLDELIQKRLIEQAAKSKGMTVEQLTGSVVSQSGAVTPSDVDFIIAYESVKDQVGATTPPGRQRLEEAIRLARAAQARHAIIESMQKSASVETLLEPPRVAVSTANAQRIGSDAAPVHLVVFTDFECPYCKESEQTLRDLKATYGDRLAIYFRNFPLPNHLYAMPSAAAAACAAEQGHYLEYHDWLFAHQNELAHADYDAWAAQLGLDRAKFAACRNDPATQKLIDEDIRDGVASGVAGTPAFFVNGRLVRETQALASVVAEEIQRSAN